MKKNLHENQECYKCGRKYAEVECWLPAYDEFDQPRKETHRYAHAECLKQEQGTKGIMVGFMLFD